MSSGFRYVLAGACVIAVLFVALSLWSYVPQMDIVWTPRGTPRAPVTSPTPPMAPAAPAVSSPGAPTTPATSLSAPTSAVPPATPAPAAPGPGPLSNQITLRSQAAGAQSAITQLDDSAPALWLQTTDNAIVRKKPGGDPLLAPSVSHAPLTVYSGSYLREVRREREWVLILSPSKTLGWVHERQVRPAGM
jgi:hypothetical protein